MRVPVVLSLHPTRLEIYFRSLLLFLSTPSKCRERFPGQFISRDNEHAIRLWIGHIDDPQIPARICLPTAILAPSNPARSSPDSSKTSMTSSSFTPCR